jgi:hypothetical protein
MNILLGLLSLVLGLCVFFGILKLLEPMFQKFYKNSKIITNENNSETTYKGRLHYYLIKIRTCVLGASLFLGVFYSADIVEGFLISHDSDFWITIFGIGILVTAILIIWIIIQYMGDLSYEHGLKGIGDKSIKNMNIFFRIYWRIFGGLFFSWLFVLPISNTHLGLVDNIYNNLLGISYYGFIGMLFLALGLVGLEIRVESNIKERVTGVKDKDDYGRHKY